ncbi:MAG: hypothetical protein DM484_17415 [Candidatus Methylumidiphilus alinenensis]|uniref:Uncharacterized protein n=1 Tax=Candidatus Methylumidiphilus alinenensis TaxID=2202197 RepID=A0A2W4QYQ5_9GAMM|nr:MAG: hypothetical protein DM484_17415 [Candidatus Methylumidiphilus alinenensis]
MKLLMDYREHGLEELYQHPQKPLVALPLQPLQQNLKIYLILPQTRTPLSKMAAREITEPTQCLMRCVGIR